MSDLKSTSLLTLVFIPLAVFANDNLIAQRLYDAERYAEAAEIYTDPAWKGVALYRSSQWWRAAEAFVRADDADSYYNLGNAYVKLGYYALALDAYKAAMSKRKNFDDAEFNAELMRQLLSQEDEDENAQAALRRQGEEIDRVDSDDTQSGDSGEPESEEKNETEENDSDATQGATDERGPTPDAVRDGDSGEAGSENTPQTQSKPEGGSVKGSEADSDEQNNPSGGSDSQQQSADPQAAGLRSQLEAQQATEQWLNQIDHDAEKYLRRRIELEIRRRRAAGESAPAGGNQW